jgi:hypothetical protein
VSAAGAAALLYQALGEAAPTLGDDAAVVHLYEAARRLGEVAHLLGGAPGDAPAALREVVNDALGDGSGLVAWGLLARAVGPRLLAALREAGSRVPDGARALTEEALGALGAPDPGAEPDWEEAVSALAARLDVAGLAESLAPDR